MLRMVGKYYCTLFVLKSLYVLRQSVEDKLNMEKDKLEII